MGFDKIDRYWQKLVLEFTRKPRMFGSNVLYISCKARDDRPCNPYGTETAIIDVVFKDFNKIDDFHLIAMVLREIWKDDDVIVKLKPKIYTYLGIYSGNDLGPGGRGIRPCIALSRKEAPFIGSAADDGLFQQVCTISADDEDY